MTWIKVTDEAEADSALREAYQKVSARRGSVANILKAHSIHPKVMTAHLTLYRELMFGRSELTRVEREMIAIAVSVTNHCYY
jgi:uncharacterized peroxidase-related enzyme